MTDSNQKVKGYIDYIMQLFNHDTRDTVLPVSIELSKPFSYIHYPTFENPKRITIKGIKMTGEVIAEDENGEYKGIELFYLPFDILEGLFEAFEKTNIVYHYN